MRGIRDLETRHKVLEALKGASSVTAAAKAAGTSRMVVYRWAKRDPEVQEAVDQLQARRRERRRGGGQPESPPPGSPPPVRSLAELEEVLAEAKRNGDVILGLEVLREIAQNGECRPQARVSAAKELIKLGLEEEARRRWERPRPDTTPATEQPSPADGAGEGEAEPPAPLNLEAAKKKLLGGA